MKNSASWLPISAVSGCYVRYRGGGAGERRGNCFGLQHCMISIITAKDLIHLHIQNPLLCAFTAVTSHCSSGCACLAMGSWGVFVAGVACYVTGRQQWWSWVVKCGVTALQTQRGNRMGVNDRCWVNALCQLLPTSRGSLPDGTKEILNTA